jgi:hypothetical protein
VLLQPLTVLPLLLKALLLQLPKLWLQPQLQLSNSVRNYG